jgi:uncharacterized protein (TIGR02594 family)
MTTTATLIPASIRHKNPGAMGLGSSAKRFGATKSTTLNDGARNTIATFPTSVDGAGALFHLLYTVYAGLTLWDALHKWGDGATIEAKGKALDVRGKVMEGRLLQAQARARTDGYAASIEKRSRWRRGDVITKARLEDPAAAIDVGRAMAWHEAGIEFPMSDAQWAEAHEQFVTVIRGGSILLDRKQPAVNLKPLEMARSHLGEREIPGPKQHNPFIVQCFADVGSTIRNDETAWCAAFAGAMLMRSGCAHLPGVLEARKYLRYGHALDEPEEGCLVIFWRVSPNSWEGHVAFVESFTATHLTIIGGNQRGPSGNSDSVTRTVVARTGAGSQVLGYRRPVAAVRSAKEVLTDTGIQQRTVSAIGTLGALLWSVWHGVERAAQVVGEMIGMLPETASSVGSTVAAGQQLTDAAGMPWPVQLGLVLTVCALAFEGYRAWQRLRPNAGDLTKPDYETDEVPTDDGAEDAFASAADPAPATFTQAEVDAMISAAVEKATPKRKTVKKTKVTA